MCRWLLRIRDLTGAMNFFSRRIQMLGVQRSSVSLVAGTLQKKAGFIKYARGHIVLLNIEQIGQGACERMRNVKGYYERLLAI